MNSINLLPKKSVNEGKLLVIKKKVKMVTSIVLVVYIVIAAAVVGWWLFIAGIDNLTAKTKADLEAQIRQSTATESLVWQADSRQKLINEFLASKNSVASISAKLAPQDEGLALDAWEYTATTHTLTGRFQQIDQMEKYTERMKANFPNISITTLSNQSTPTWTAVIKL